jgi:hypothetical protein
MSITANLKHAARNNGAHIGGGEFTREECAEAVAMLEQREELLRAAKRLLSLYSRRERELRVELADLETAVNIVKEN